MAEVKIEETELQPAESSSRKRFFILGAVALLLVGTALFWWHSTYYEDTDDAQIDGRLVQVSARIKGYIIKLNVEDNQRVEKGQVLVQIDPRNFQTALDKAEAALTSAQANYEAMLVNVPITDVNTSSQLRSAGSDVKGALDSIAQAEKQLDAAQAQVLVAEANNTKAQLDLERYTPLVKRDVISKQQYDAAVAAAAGSKAQLQEAQANLSAAQQGVHISKERLAQAQAGYSAALTGPKQVAAQKARADQAAAQVQEAQAAVEQARLDLSYTVITAPESGIVNNKTVEVGQNVSDGQTLMTLVPLEDVWVTANFKETQLTHMRAGQPVVITVDAYGNREYHGKITQIGGATGSMLGLFPPENATGNYVKVVQRIPVRIDFTNPDENKDHLLRPGMSVIPTVRVKD
ncbi:MAG: HlyD family secretion protein [Acidobacteriaceae bacterium]